MLPQLSLRVGSQQEGGPREEVEEKRWRPEVGGAHLGRTSEGFGVMPAWFQRGGAGDENSSHGGQAAFMQLLGRRDNAPEQGQGAGFTPPNWSFEAFAAMAGGKLPEGSQGSGAFANGALRPTSGEASEWSRLPGRTEPGTGNGGASGTGKTAAGGKGKKRKAVAAPAQGAPQSARTGPITHVFSWGGDGGAGNRDAPAGGENDMKDGPGVELSLASPNQGRVSGGREGQMQIDALAAASAQGASLSAAQIASYFGSFSAKDRNALGWGRDLDLTKR